MAFKHFWLKLIKSISFKYRFLENFLYTGKCNFLVEFSRSSLKIFEILIRRKFGSLCQLEFFLIGHIIILKSGVGLIVLGTCVFKIQKIKLKTKQNLIGLICKYSTIINILMLHNYFKVTFLLER
jgi:hypothetical protein